MIPLLSPHLSWLLLVRTVVAVRRAGFKTALKSVLRPLFAHPLHSEKEDDQLVRKAISDQQRGNFLRYIRKEDGIRSPTRQHVWISYCKVCINMNNLNLLSLNDGMQSFKNIMQSFPITDARPAFYSIYRTISSSIHPYVNPSSICTSICLSISRSLHPSFYSSSIYLYTGCRPPPPFIYA